MWGSGGTSPLVENKILLLNNVCDGNRNLPRNEDKSIEFIVC